MRRHCPKCQADLEDAEREVCPFCGARVSPERGTKLVAVFEADNLIHARLVRGILEGSRVPAWVANEETHST